MSNAENDSATDSPQSNIPDPGVIESWAEEAWNDVLIEFARCSGYFPEGDILDEIKELFDNTIGAGITGIGVAWEEPLRSFGLRHVCKIAKRYKRCCDETSLTETTDAVVEQARKSCEVLEAQGKLGETGVLCPSE